MHSGRAVQDVRIYGLVETVDGQRNDLVGVDWSVGAPKLLGVPCRADRMCNMCDMRFADEVVSAPGVDEPSVDVSDRAAATGANGPGATSVGTSWSW